MLAKPISTKYVLGKQSVVGDPRRKYEDRVHSGEIKRKDGSSFFVAIVADGVGSADFGSRGAQLAIDIAIDLLHRSRGENIPLILKKTIERANKAVYEDNEANNGDGLTTLTIAAIYNDRCYVANVGDSRVYWIQNGKMLQLTRDHSYHNVYGGLPTDVNADVLVNAIGKSADVQVDLGVYLKGEDQTQANRLGMAGLPLKPGDSILVCSDGLIKGDARGERYAKDVEIVNALTSEFEENKAAIKIVSTAEGRRPDDNVSAVTLQYLSSEIIERIKAHAKGAKLWQRALRLGAGTLAFMAVVLIGFLTYRINTVTNETQTPQIEYWTLTSASTMTPTLQIAPDQARVDQVNGQGANVQVGQHLDSGASLITGDSGVKIIVGDQEGRAGITYLFRDSKVDMVFDAIAMRPVLQEGAIYVQPANHGKAEIFFENWPNLMETVSGSRMIVEIIDGDIWVYCFEGKCQLEKGYEARTVPVGTKRVYTTSIGLWEEPVEMPYSEQWAWNEMCNYCMYGYIETPTPTPINQGSENPGSSSSSGENSTISTAVPPTAVPPTAVPPTAVLPTAVPPTAIPVCECGVKGNGDCKKCPQN